MNIPCGRTKETKHLCCLNPDFSWRTNKLYLTQVRFLPYVSILPDKNRNRIVKIHYEIRCKKCGCIREMGNTFSFKVIKELITGKLEF